MLKMLLLFVLAALCKADLELATDCVQEKCQLPNCRCPSTAIPGGLSAEETPQFVLFTFDDAVTALNHRFYQEAFDNRYNPDGCPVATTSFMSHEYTDYSVVHQLHAAGHEIALHSITHTTTTTYWQTISVEELKKEFGGQINLTAHFANIPSEDIKGMRVPFLQLSGNNTFYAGKQVGLSYDSSWPTQTYIQPGLWPYTLDHATTQDCPIGPCPDASIPGFWVVPMIMWRDSSDVVCSMVDACIFIPDNEDELLELFIENFERQYNGNRAPFGVYLHAAWFYLNDYNFNVYKRFIDYIQQKNDVYIVGFQRMLEWVKNPQPLGKLDQVWSSCQKTYTPNCTPQACQLQNLDGAERWMTICASVGCPNNYPWIGNPLGE